MLAELLDLHILNFSGYTIENHYDFKNRHYSGQIKLIYLAI